MTRFDALDPAGPADPDRGGGAVSPSCRGYRMTARLNVAASLG